VRSYAVLMRSIPNIMVIIIVWIWNRIIIMMAVRWAVMVAMGVEVEGRKISQE